MGCWERSGSQNSLCKRPNRCLWFSCPYFLLFLDPSHERAGGNLRYFERLLEEEREKPLSNQTEAGLATQENFYDRPMDYLPERDVYESLCRGEGVKLVRPGKGPEVRLGF